MAFDQTHIPSTEPEITLVDIEELRKMLGAEANILDEDAMTVAACNGTPGSTCMCPRWLE